MSIHRGFTHADACTADSGEYNHDRANTGRLLLDEREYPRRHHGVVGVMRAMFDSVTRREATLAVDAAHLAPEAHSNELGRFATSVSTTHH